MAEAVAVAWNGMKAQFPRLACCGAKSNKMLGSANKSKICKDRGARPLLTGGGSRKRALKLATMSRDGVYGSLRFGPFELSSRERALRREGLQLPLGSRALDILVYLAERPGEVIPKRELLDHVWSGVAVEEGSLRVHVAAIRKALRDGQFGNRYIANIKGRGYSFVGTVVRLEDGKDGGSCSPNFRGRLASPLMLIGREAAVSEVRNWIRQGRFVTPGWSRRRRLDDGHRVAAGHDTDVRLIAALVHALKARR
jgi:DNA-binding winged helix-turn-helix (wHTH) protein